MSKWIAEFELEDGDTMPELMELEYKGAKLNFRCKPATANTESLDDNTYKAQYKRFLEKAEIVISQLRTDRDRLLEAFDKVAVEIKAIPSANPSYWHDSDVIDRDAVLEIIDEYKEGTAEKEIKSQESEAKE